MLITCQNERLTREGNRVPCQRILADFPDRLLRDLREGEEIVLRCPSCPKNQRYARISKSEGLSWESTGDAPEYVKENAVHFNHSITVREVE